MHLGPERRAQLAISPDDRHVYASRPNDWQIEVYERSALDGSLLLQQTVSQGGDGIPLLREPSALAIGGDGTRLYASCADSDAVLAFARDAQTGHLAYLGAAAEGVGDVVTLLGVAGLAADPSRAQVYVAAETDGAITALATAAATPVVADFETQGRLGVTDLAGATALAASPDGVHLYAAAATSDAVVTLVLPEPAPAIASAAALLALACSAMRKRARREASPDMMRRCATPPASRSSCSAS